jgi:hypothetical protein
MRTAARARANACSEYSAVQCEYSAVQCEYSAVRRESTRSSRAAQLQECGSILLAGTKLRAERLSGLYSRSDRTMPMVKARACRRRRRSSVCRRDACITYAWHNEQAACVARKLTRPNTPEEAALCFEPRANTVTRIRHPNVPELAIASCAHGRLMQGRGRCRLDVGWTRLRASLPSYRWASRCRMRGARGNLHSTKAAWTPQTHGIQQYRRGMNAASSPFCQNGISRLAATDRSWVRQQIDGIGRPRATLCSMHRH